MLDKKTVLNLTKDIFYTSCMMLFICYHQNSISNLIEHYTKDWYSVFEFFQVVIIAITFSFFIVCGIYRRFDVKVTNTLGLAVLFPLLLIQIINKSILNHTITLGEFIIKLIVCVLVCFISSRFFLK